MSITKTINLIYKLLKFKKALIENGKMNKRRTQGKRLQYATLVDAETEIQLN